MQTLIDAAFSRSRTVLLTLLLVIIAGGITYVQIPKEADPDIQIPIIYVSMNHDGISPEDSERLLVRPMETQLQSIEGVKEIRSVAGQGHGSVTLEFDAGIDIDQALADVREEVDIAKADLPDDTDEPTVNEVNLALFPVLVVTLSGDMPERRLLEIARDLEESIETLRNVLDVEIAGEREELLEIIVEPERIRHYGLVLEDVLSIVQRNNRLVAAGSLDTGQGRFAVKVDGVFEEANQLLNLPLKVSGDQVVRIGDIVSLRRTFKDAESFARVDGRPALALEVSKRIGANIIETVQQVREVVATEQQFWPASIEVGFSQDKSDNINSMLNDLQNNVLSAVLLVMIVVVAALGFRSASLVGFAVPGSFLTGILVLGSLGLTVNIVVLFALILAVGMLVDGAIVVVELADRKMAEGMHRVEAYKHAAKRMCWPITASTATTLAAFLPLIFWPGIVGEFMKYLPITLVATLSASLLMALIFVPNLGALFGKAEAADPQTMKLLGADNSDQLHKAKGLVGVYVRFLSKALKHPFLVTFLAFIIAISAYVSYGMFGRGVEFFPDVEPEVAQLHVHARGDLAVLERDQLVNEVETRIVDIPGIERIYARAGLEFRGDEVDEDVIGVILMEFEPWDQRRPAVEILADVKAATADLAGIHVEPRKEEAGPPVGKPVQVQIVSRESSAIDPVVVDVREFFEGLNGLTEISDSRPLPGLEWRFVVDREQASRFGADIAQIGATIQLVTNGLLVDTYRPEDAEDEVDIRVRLPMARRTLDVFDQLVINTSRGPVPLSTFVTLSPAPKSGTIERVEGKRAITVAADIEDGVLADDMVRQVKAWLAAQEFDSAVEIEFKGEDEEQQEAGAFLSKAFGVALFLIAIILVTQFNSFYQAFLILSAIIFSTVGVLLGLLATNQPFGIVMSGVGVIALAGIVVNNNIVLIDTFNDLKRRGLPVFDAILLTGAQRLRPVLLTTITTILGLMPMVLKLNIDLFEPRITQGGPSTDWWAQLASAIAGGLAFATLLTLVLTPCLLMLGDVVGRWTQRMWQRLRRKPAASVQPAE